MAQSVGGLRILLAEDETLAALVVSDALVEIGHSVAHAADGEAALGLASAIPFDVLITDLAMPRLSGLQLILRLREDRPDLPVVMMTGWLPPDGAKLLATSAAGRTALLLKPFDMTQLAGALARVSAGAAPVGCDTVPNGTGPGNTPSGQATPVA